MVDVTRIVEGSETPATNESLNSISIAEGWAPSVVNNAVRELISQLRKMTSGTDPIGYSTDATATVGPVLELHRNSASPADDDFIGAFNFMGENDASEEVIYAQILTQIKDVTDATEDGNFLIKVMIAGTLTTVATIDAAGLALVGGLTISGFLQNSITDSITAGTTQTQAGATTLTTGINRVTVSGTDGDGVELPSAVAGMRILIINDDSAQTIQVWPNTSDAIDGGSADAVDANTIAAGSSREYIATDATNWYTANAAAAAAGDGTVGVAFSAYGSGIASNVTGDGTTVSPVGMDAELFDLGGDFAIGTYTFTAPSTGKYRFNCSVSAYGGSTSHTDMVVSIVTSNRTYEVFRGNPKDAIATSITAGGSVLADMDAADTAFVSCTVSGSTKVIDLDNGVRTGFQGEIVA
jgi:hypothetical protein